MLHTTSSRLTPLHRYGLRLLLFFVLGVLLSVKFLTVTANATSSFFSNCEMQTTGKLYYVHSDSNYEPIRSFEDGIEHTLYFSSSAERAFANDPYLVNLTESVVNGWIGDGYKIKAELGGYLAIYQPHNSINNYQRDAWAYYEFVPTEENTNTNMLYRPERNDNYITILCAGGILITLYCVFKMIRND